jgi:hypothetical protein
VNKLDLLFDSKQFEVAFAEAIGEYASARSESEAASVGAGLSRNGGQNVVHAPSEDQCTSRPALNAGDLSDEVPNLLHAPPIEG